MHITHFREEAKWKFLTQQFQENLELMKIIWKYSSSFESRKYEPSDFLKPKTLLQKIILT